MQALNSLGTPVAMFEAALHPGLVFVDNAPFRFGHSGAAEADEAGVAAW